MDGLVLRKPRGGWTVPPTMPDYHETRQGFSWAEARRWLQGLPDGGLNIAHEAVDRHAQGARRTQTALRWIAKSGAVRNITYGELAAATSRFANALRALGVGRDERVFTLLGRVPELYVAALGTLKNGSVFCPLFSAFGPDPVRTRLALGDGRVLVTTDRLYHSKVAPIRPDLPQLRHVLLVSDRAEHELPTGTRSLRTLLAASGDRCAVAPTRPEEMAILHFTSGTTGTPKGAIHVHEAVIAHRATAHQALDLRPGDVFWCTADPGWVTGVSYGIVAPLVVGATVIVDEEEFDADRWFAILRDQAVDVWYTAPTAIRMLMRWEAAGGPTPRVARPPRLLASVGEPLNPQGAVWGQDRFGSPIHDTWWQTETGAIMIANFRAMDVKPGSMGRPMPGVEATVVRRRDDGGIDFVREPGAEGELALRAGWPSMFRGYLGEPERYRACFRDGWYLTGDLVRYDGDGFVWFVGRTDDVIKSSGHLIGPFEVENVLLDFPSVAEAGVIGRPDPIAGEIVKAFVTLKPGHAASAELERQLLAHARRRLGAAVAPREIAFVTFLPKTRSGKIMRRLLKAGETGTAAGDISTLEPPS